jgi:hypothetical protein
LDRAQFLGRLEAEARQADWCGERDRAAELRAQVRRASAGTPVPPARETAARRPAGRQRQ